MSDKKVAPFPVLIIQEFLADIEWAIQPIVKWARALGIPMASRRPAKTTATSCFAQLCSSPLFIASFALAVVNATCSIYFISDTVSTLGRSASATSDWNNLISRTNFAITTFVTHVGLFTVFVLRWPGFLRALRALDRYSAISQDTVKKTRHVCTLGSILLALVIRFIAWKLIASLV